MKNKNAVKDNKTTMINLIQQEPVYVLTHNDLDGNMALYTAQRFMNVTGYDAVSYGKVTEKLDEFFRTQAEHNTYAAIVITDVNLNMEQLKRLDEAGANGLPVFYMDHHYKSVEAEELLNGGDACHIYNQVSDEYCAAKILYNWLTRNGVPVLENDGFDVERFEEILDKVDAWDTFKWIDNNTFEVLNEGARDLSIYFTKRGARLTMAKIDKYVYGEYQYLFSNIENGILKDTKTTTDRKVNFLNNNLTTISVTISGKSYNCGVVFAESDLSYIGNKLCVLNPNMDFMVLVNMNARTVDFRGIHETVNLAKIAASFNGGGHPKSAGCPLNSAAFNQFVKASVFKPVAQKDIAADAADEDTPKAEEAPADTGDTSEGTAE